MAQHPALAALYAVVAGALWGACFGRAALPIAACVALAPFFILLGSSAAARPRGAAWLGWLHGVAAWSVSLFWIVPTLHTYGELGTGVAIALLLALNAVLALFHALFAVAAASCWRHRSLPSREGEGRGWLGYRGYREYRGYRLWLGLPAIWVAIEGLRNWLPFGGFPWNLAAYAWTEMPGALPVSAWIGAWGVSALLVLTNLAVAHAVVRKRFEPAAMAFGLVFFLLAVGGRWGAGGGGAGSGMERSAADVGYPVRVVQPNIPNLVAWDAEAVAAGYERLLRLSRDACDEPGALLVWPESAAWPRIYPADARLRADIEGLAAAGCPVLLNSVRSEGDRVFNSAFLVTGPESFSYADKRHLVPFGEYAPGREVIPFVGKLARNAGDFRPASELRLLPWGPLRLGPAICFEVIFPGETAALVRAGASALVTVTNDAWYGDTAAPWQHFRAVQFRAAETRRPFVRAAITGVSGLVRADGAVTALLGVGEQGILRGRVVGRRDLSPFVRAPWLVVSLAVAMALFVMLKR